ncbi:hypothetical protein EOB36_03460 [Mesorhizobium sp. M6A.T.Cr.TU.017.01.1.1]|uniref:hypothetical protein n=1 Tax=Mesorhizobium sp. M6A.T.Cr.TU.017.01.1.1 TaxID=2496774 RepID=UPI000FD27A41|nr:hypothetical protein [Mesorhizobium sp. M6A.T.Cr.TU.017.01.1.1]RUV04321.1 hypothetical protein EOB36_03460 [Mesorhizobium sp. M6A.T.Cr.TU.017.01.1.1]
MTMPAPPVDLNRQERKAFKILAQRLADRGVDALARAGLIAEVVRMEARLTYLREAEKSAENGSKMAATRALNVATAELRRITVELFRGAAKVDAAVPIQVAAALTINDADEAWQRHLHWGDKSFSHDGLEAKFGRPSWSALLFRTEAECVGVNRLLDKYRPRCIPSTDLDELYREIGLPPPGPRNGAAVARGEEVDT